MNFKTYLEAYEKINQCKTGILAIQKEIEHIEKIVQDSRKNGGPLTEPSRPSQIDASSQTEDICEEFPGYLRGLIEEPGYIPDIYSDGDHWYSDVEKKPFVVEFKLNGVSLL